MRSKTIKGRTVEGHELTVQVVKPDGPLPRVTCCMSAARRETIHPVARGVEAHRCSRGDGEKFAETGGVAQLVLENDRMRFTINVTSAGARG